MRFAAHVEGEGVAFFEAAKGIGVEGIVAKLRRSRYEPGRRSPAWLKIKIRPEQELVVGGWTPGSGNARDLGALAVGVYEDGKLRFAGKVGSGFTGAIRADLLRSAQAARRDDPPFDPPPPQGLPWALGRRPPGHHLGQPGARDPGRARWLDPRRPRPPDGVQGLRARPRPQHRPTRDRDHHGDRGPDRRSGGTTRCRRSRAPRQRRSVARTPAPPPTFPGATDEELAALDAMGKEGLWQVGGHELKLTNLDKPLFEGRGADDGADHQARADPLLRAHRPDDAAPPPRPTAQPAALPERGRRAQGFWQKNMPESSPRWLTTWHETGVDGRTDRSANDHLIADTRGVAVLARATRRASRSTPGPASCRSRGSRRSPTSTSTRARRRPGTTR